MQKSAYLRLGLLTVGALGASLATGGVACGGGSDSTFEPQVGDDGGGTLFGEGGFGSGDGAEVPFVCNPDPKNAEVPGNNCDDDGDGKVDNVTSCDTGAAAGTAEGFAKAIGICDLATGPKGYGLVSAAFSRGFGRTDAPPAEQHGVLPKFGSAVKPREGSMLGVLSTGYAQEYDGASGTPFGGEKSDGTSNGKDWFNFGRYQPGAKSNGSVPPGFPKAAAGCDQAPTTNDVVDLKLTIKAPPNVSGIKFDFNFYSGEWPAYICSAFNDGFIAYLSAKGFNGGTADNISFDSKKNPVSVNNGFFDRCTPNADIGCAAGAKSGKSQCPGGTGELLGTGFGIDGAWCDVNGYPSRLKGRTTNGGATGWLTSTAPVTPGETFTIEFIIWDTGDAVLDSSILLDNFAWATGVVTNTTVRPPL